MDLRTTAQELLSLPEKEEEELDLKILFVAPAPREMPEDGVLHYEVLTDVYDFDRIEARSCVLIADDVLDVAELVAKHPVLFGVRMVRLDGIPGANYSVEFESSVWNTDRVAYNALISEINMVKEAEEAASINSASVHDLEKKQYTRANGTVKDNTNFVLSDDSESED